MSIYLPHRHDILAPVEPLARLLPPGPLAHWRLDAATWKDTGRRDLPLPRPLERIFRSMRAATRLLLFGNTLTAAQRWSNYVNGGGGSPFPPVGWWSMRATSGTNEANRGAGGAALDMTITSATLGQTGKLGANEAALCDGANTRYQTANNAALANLTTFEWVFLVNPSSAGEANSGSFYIWGDGAADSESFLVFNGVVTSLLSYEWNTTPTQFITLTTSGIAPSAWSLVFRAYNDGGDRKIHLYKGVTGAVSEYAYSAEPPLTGTHRSAAKPLNLFNRSNQGLTFAGLADEALIVNGNLSAAQRTQLCVLAGV